MGLERGNRNYWRALAALFMGSFVEFALLYVTQPLLPALTADFSLSPSVASLSVSLTTGAMALALLPLAAVFSRLQRKPTMLSAMLGASLLAIASGCSPNFELLLVCRALQGMLMAAFPAAAMAYVNEEFEPSGVGLAMGIYIAGTSIGGLGGRLLVSLLSDFMSWRTALLVMGGFCLLLAICFFWLLPKAQSRRSTAAKQAGLLAALPSLLKTPGILPLYIVGFVALGSFVALYNYIGYILLAAPYSFSQSQVGAVFLLYLLGTVSSMVSGGQVDRRGPGPVLVAGLLMMLGGALFSLGTPLLFKLGGLGLFTCGFFTTHATASGWVGRLCRGDKAQAASLYLFFYYVGASVIGTGSGIFLASAGWAGVIGVTALLLSGALWLAWRQQGLNRRTEVT